MTLVSDVSVGTGDSIFTLISRCKNKQLAIYEFTYTDHCHCVCVLVLRFTMWSQVHERQITVFMPHVHSILQCLSNRGKLFNSVPYSIEAGWHEDYFIYCVKPDYSFNQRPYKVLQKSLINHWCWILRALKYLLRRYTISL